MTRDVLGSLFESFFLQRNIKKMKYKTITLREKFNLGNYESEDIEISIELEENEDIDVSFQVLKAKILYLHYNFMKGGTKFKMVSIKEFAQAYEPQQMKNIADLEVVEANIEIKKETRKDQNSEEYSVMFIVKDGEEYRVPPSVVTQLKAVIEAKPDLAKFKVTKTGQGMGTKYQVISL